MGETPQPKLGVSAIVYAKSQILLAKRGKEPAKGLWSLPGGSLEFGERLHEGAIREVFEETNVKLDQVSFVETAEAITESYHFVIHVFITQLNDICPIKAGDDAEAVNWFSLYEVEKLNEAKLMTPGTAKRIARIISAL